MEVKDLEGEYFVFDFSADYTYESSLVILQLKEGKLEQLFHPCDDAGIAIDTIGEYSSEKAIEFLKKKRYKKSLHS